MHCQWLDLDSSEEYKRCFQSDTLCRQFHYNDPNTWHFGNTRNFLVFPVRLWNQTFRPRKPFLFTPSLYATYGKWYHTRAIYAIIRDVLLPCGDFVGQTSLAGRAPLSHMLSADISCLISKSLIDIHTNMTKYFFPHLEIGYNHAYERPWSFLNWNFLMRMLP